MSEDLPILYLFDRVTRKQSYLSLQSPLFNPVWSPQKLAAVLTLHPSVRFYPANDISGQQIRLRKSPSFYLPRIEYMSNSSLPCPLRRRLYILQLTNLCLCLTPLRGSGQSPPKTANLQSYSKLLSISPYVILPSVWRRGNLRNSVSTGVRRPLLCQTPSCTRYACLPQSDVMLTGKSVLWGAGQAQRRQRRQRRQNPCRPTGRTCFADLYAG